MERKIASVNFPSRGSRVTDTSYHFFTYLTDLDEGDQLVADTVNGLVVVTFERYIAKSGMAEKWLVQKIYTDEHNARVKEINDIEDIKRELDNKVRSLSDLELYELLAEENIEIRRLLEKYKYKVQ